MSEAQKITSLELKPDLAEATQRWLAFWQQEIIDRPVCSIRAPKAGAEPVYGMRYMEGAREEFGPIVERALAWGRSIYWAGDSIPCYVPSFGPDQMSAWLGAELVFPEHETGTNWVPACIDDWEKALPFRLDPENYWWKRSQAFLRALAEGLRGKMLVTHLDLHSNMDTLLAMRGGMDLCVDMKDIPETIDRAMASVRQLYVPIYEALYEAGNMGAAGTLGWVNAYHPERTNTIQCDFAALIGPEHFKRWVMPALEEEAAYLKHCVYHFDGPECLVHQEDICSIPGLDCIQWVHGARNKPFIEWMDLLKEMQRLGKSVWVNCSAEQVKVFHRELKPNMLFYDVWASSEKEADETLAWLKANT